METKHIEEYLAYTLKEFNKRKAASYAIDRAQLYTHHKIYFEDWEGERKGGLQYYVKRLVRKIGWPFLARQVAFNSAALHSLENMYAFAESLNERITALEATLNHAKESTDAIKVSPPKGV